MNAGLRIARWATSSRVPAADRNQVRHFRGGTTGRPTMQGRARVARRGFVGRGVLEIRVPGRMPDWLLGTTRRPLHVSQSDGSGRARISSIYTVFSAE